MKVRFYKGVNGQPLTPCCKKPFIVNAEIFGLDVCFCSKCGQEFDKNLRPVKK